MHKHDYFHLQVILGGVASMRIGEEEWMVQSEQIYLIAPNVMHTICDSSNGKVPLRMYDIKFVANDRALHDELIGLPNPFISGHFPHFSAQLETLLDESYQLLPYAADVINARFLLMLTGIVRQIRKNHSRPETVPNEEENHYIVCGINMPRLVKYIRSNLSQNITLDSLAGVASINKTTLTEAFKKCYGVTPMRYVNQLRLSYAKEMLINSDTSIHEIAQSIGFTHHYLSRFFKAQMQCTPQEFRVQHASNRFYVVSEDMYKHG